MTDTTGTYVDAPPGYREVPDPIHADSVICADCPDPVEVSVEPCPHCGPAAITEAA